MNALILVAHADDETLGAGGTIQKLVRRGWHVQVIILSDGIVRARGGEQDNRPDAITACQLLGVGAPRFLDVPDQKFDTVPMAELASRVAEVKFDADLIITHVDTDLNLDHRITCDVARILARPRAKPITIIGCEIPNTSAWKGQPFLPNYYVDISNEIDTKIEAFSAYRHECQPYPHPWSREGLRLLAQYHGMQAGLRMAEAFHVIRGYEGHFPS